MIARRSGTPKAAGARGRKKAAVSSLHHGASSSLLGIRKPESPRAGSLETWARRATNQNSLIDDLVADEHAAAAAANQAASSTALAVQPPLPPRDAVRSSPRLSSNDEIF